MNATEFSFLDQHLMLHPLRAIFWQEQNTLLLSDLHLGKVAHFRKEGYAVPITAGDENWDKLLHLMLDFKPERVLILGDLFHSSYNREWESFGAFMAQFQQTHFELVLGNHDILSADQYERFGMQPKVYLKEGPFLFTHEPIEDEQLYNLSGHIHPCVWLSGRGRQRLKLPCFYFGQKQGILPAFGAFTGMAKIAVKEADQIFVVAENAVIQV